MPRLRISPEAQRDIDEIYLYGALRYGLGQADGYLAGMQNLLDTVARNPQMAREREEIRPPIRLLRYEAHHLFYDVIDGGVVLQRVLHHSTDWMTTF